MSYQDVRLKKYPGVFNMKKTILCILVLALSLTGFSRTGNDFLKIEQRIEKEISKGAIPSIAIAVAKDGKIVYEKAFGWSDIGAKVKATINTSYQLASVSKPMTATGLMVLHRKRIITIDSPAEDYMSPLKFKTYEGKASDIRLKNLLNHTSGLGTYFDISYADEKIRKDSFEEAFNKYGNTYYPPGSISEYSNLGYGLIDYIIARQSGKSFARFMQEEVFEPLGMADSFVQHTNRSDITIAKKYDSALRVLPDILNNTYGAGNLFSSIHDLILFGMFHLKNNLKNQKQILSREEIDLMHYYRDTNTLYPYYDSAVYGLGWYFKPNENGYKIVWHEGGMMGASSIIKLIPENNIAIAVIINSSNRQFCNEIANELSKIVLPDYQPTPLNEDSEVAYYRPYTTDPSYFGDWAGTIKVEDLNIPCTLKFQPDGNIIITYSDLTYKSYLTQDNPIPHKTILLVGIINKESFIGMFPGTLPSKDIRKEFSQIMSLKLYKKGRTLSGTIVALAASNREYYAYPFYIKLEKK
jgi:CubicO group peptidase (beta-lactamase class C family)